MPLKTKDLEDERARLQGVISLAKEALDAIDKLLAVRYKENITEDAQETNIKKMSVKKAVLAIQKENYPAFFTNSQMEEKILMRDPKRKYKGRGLRTNIGNAHRDLCNEGILEKKDIGINKQTEYAYRFKKTESENSDN